MKKRAIVVVICAICCVFVFAQAYSVQTDPDSGNSFFARQYYKEDIFPEDCSYELISLDNDMAVMLYVITDGNRIKSISDHIDTFRPYIMQDPGEPELKDIAGLYDYLVKKGETPFVYRFTLLDKNTGTEKGIASFIDPVINKKVHKKVVFRKPVLYDAAVNDDISLFRLIVDYGNDLMFLELDLKQLFDRSSGETKLRGAVKRCMVAQRMSDLSLAACFLTPDIVEVSFREPREKNGKEDGFVNIKYHVMPVPSVSSEFRLWNRIKWCSRECNARTFNYVLSAMTIENEKECNFYDPETETGGPHKWTGVPEPEYGLSEWEGWTRMNHSSDWLKK